MIYGSYRQKVDWNSFKVEPESLTNMFQARSQRFGYRMEPSNSFESCGTSALSLLTGLTPRHVERFMSKRKGLWTGKAAVQFLKSRGFIVKELSQYGVTNLSPHNSYEWQYQPLRSVHVLLCDLLMCREEASWWVVHNNYSYHNFRVESLNPLLFCNKPSQAIYLVRHPKWPIF